MPRALGRERPVTTELTPRTEAAPCANALLGQGNGGSSPSMAPLLTISTLARLLSAVIGSNFTESSGQRVVPHARLRPAVPRVQHARAESGLFLNAVTRNAYVWIAVALCSALLLLAVYAPPLARALRLEAPDREGWILVLVASIAPLS